MLDLDNKTYIPILSIRPAEMVAFQELPEHDKELVLPAFQIRPWTSAKMLRDAIDRVELAYGKEREWIANLDSNYKNENNLVREAFTEFKSLKDSKDGYKNWCNYVAKHPKMIPALQLDDIYQFSKQLDQLAELERGLVVHTDINNLRIITSPNYLNLLQKKINFGKILVIIDFGTLNMRSDLTQLAMSVSEDIKKIKSIISPHFISISATSFPYSFDGIINQKIRERELFSIIGNTQGDDKGEMIYSDRGSARIEPLQGGGGVLYPRIDLPSMQNTETEKNDQRWHFFRSKTAGRDYAMVAKQAMESPIWNPNLKIWGGAKNRRHSHWVARVYYLPCPSDCGKN